MIKIGDKLQPTRHARLNYKFNELGIELPIVATNVFKDSNGSEVVQFLCPDPYNKNGALTLRSWNARSFEPYASKVKCVAVMGSVPNLKAKAITEDGQVYVFRNGVWQKSTLSARGFWDSFYNPVPGRLKLEGVIYVKAAL